MNTSWVASAASFAGAPSRASAPWQPDRSASRRAHRNPNRPCTPQRHGADQRFSRALRRGGAVCEDVAGQFSADGAGDAGEVGERLFGRVGRAPDPRLEVEPRGSGRGTVPRLGGRERCEVLRVGQLTDVYDRRRGLDRGDLFRGPSRSEHHEHVRPRDQAVEVLWVVARPATSPSSRRARRRPWAACLRTRSDRPTARGRG